SVCHAQNDGDPNILYDQYAQRWFGGQFGLPNYPNGPFYYCMVVSSTSDPTGTWCAYQFQVSADKMDDYPKLGVWPSQNAYMMTANQFLAPNLSYSSVGVWGFERDKMLNCDTARFVYQDMISIDPYLPATLPADADGPTPPPANAPAPLVAMHFDGSGLPSDQLQIWNATIDWGAPPSITVAHETDVQAAPYDTNLCNNNGLNCVQQPGTSQRLDTLSDRIMYRAQYRNFGGWQTIVTSHTVDAGSD